MSMEILGLIFAGLALLTSIATTAVFGRIPLRVLATAEKNGRYTGLGARESISSPPTSGRRAPASPSELRLAA